MIILGTKMAGKKNVINGWGSCENCGVYGKNSSYDGQKFGHVYYLPIIPMGGKVRVIMQCSKCSHGLHLELGSVPAIKESLVSRTSHYLDLLVSGEKEMEQDGEMISCVGSIAGVVEMLYCLELSSQVEKILSTLQENGLRFEYHQVLGQSLEFEGKLVEAIESYDQGVKLKPSDVGMLMLLASAHMKNKDAEKARDSYEAAVRYADDKFSPLYHLLSVYEKLKDFHNLAETYEKCFRHLPELAEDKKVFKAYKKACKKAGKEPVVV